MGRLWLAMAAVLALAATAQTPNGRAIGVVTSIDAANKQIAIKSDAGPDVHIAILESTSYLRVPPGSTDLKTAEKIALAEIAVGDRVLARGVSSEDKRTLTANSVIVMSKSELARKQAADRAEWQRRGVAGVVTAINPDAKEFTISARTRQGLKPLLVVAGGSVDIRRYAPDSVRFADAKPSSFADLKVGDQVRALGNRSEDGSRFTAEFIVSGSFKNVAATVVSTDPSQKSVKVTDLDTKKALTVSISADSNLRRLQPSVANMLAARLNGGGSPGGDMEQMLERQPTLDITELKPGDALIVASTAGADPNKITAITLLAGVEPILTSAPKGRQGMVLGNWNLDMGGGMGLPQ